VFVDDVYRGLKPVDKRSGGGAHNWGTITDAVQYVPLRYTVRFLFGHRVFLRSYIYFYCFHLTAISSSFPRILLFQLIQRQKVG